MFCQNCGKPLQEGEICTCQQAGDNGQQPEQQAGQDQQQYQQYQQPYQQDPYQQQGQYQQPDPYQQQYQQQQQPYQQPDPYQQQGQYQQPYQQGPKVSGLAIAGFVVSLVSIFLMAVPFGIVGIVGIILSAVALNQINRDPQNIGGKGFAIAGLIISIVFAAISIIIYISTIACLGSVGSLLGSSYYW